jgi:hypothetical protein
MDVISFEEAFMQKPLPFFQRREAAVRGRFFSADALPLWHSDDGKNKIQGQGAPCVGPNFFAFGYFPPAPPLTHGQSIKPSDSFMPM